MPKSNVAFKIKIKKTEHSSNKYRLVNRNPKDIKHVSFLK